MTFSDPFFIYVASHLVISLSRSLTFYRTLILSGMSYAYIVDIFPCDRSFNDKPVNEAATGPLGKELFEKEQEDLLSDLKDIPKKACDRRVSFPSLIFTIF